MEENKTSFAPLFNTILESAITRSLSWREICAMVVKNISENIAVREVLIGRFDENRKLQLISSSGRAKNFIYAHMISDNWDKFLTENASNLRYFGPKKEPNVLPPCHAVTAKSGDMFVLSLPLVTLDNTVEGVLEIWQDYEVTPAVIKFFEQVARFISLGAQIKRYQRKISRENDIILSFDSPMLITSSEGVIKWVNKPFVDLCKTTEDTLYERPFAAFLKDDKAKKFFERMLRDKKQSNMNFEFSLPESTLSISLNVMPLSPLDVEDHHNCLLSIENISARLADSEKIAYLTSFDPLTGLPNRAAFLNNLKEITFESGISNKPLAVLFIKLINFEHIKNTLGAEASNHMLKTLAGRINYMIKDKKMSAQITPEEFAIIIDLPGVEEKIDAIARKIIAKISEPETISEREMFLRASVGISFFPKIGDAEQLLTSAEIAAKIATFEKPGSYMLYNDKMGSDTKNKMEIEKNLRLAIENDEFLIMYQPQINILTNEIIGAEALLRWNHPEKGMISPGQFIPVAEDSGLILKIGDVQIDKILTQCKLWQNKGLSKIKVGINLSALQFNQDDLVDNIKNKIKRFDVNSENLDFEITESTLMTDFERANKILRELARLNVNISIDDFGTGYSSLNYLKRFRINTIKIDQTFIREIDRNNEDVEIVKFITNLGHLLGLDVVAEGIETEDHLEIVAAKGVNIAQGYLISRPLLPNDFENFITSYKKS